MSENSPTISSLMDTTTIKTTFGTSKLDIYCQKGYSTDAEPSQKCRHFSCLSEKVSRTSLPNVEN